MTFLPSILFEVGLLRAGHRDEVDGRAVERDRHPARLVARRGSCASCAAFTEQTSCLPSITIFGWSGGSFFAAPASRASSGAAVAATVNVKSDSAVDDGHPGECQFYALLEAARRCRSPCRRRKASLVHGHCFVSLFRGGALPIGPPRGVALPRKKVLGGDSALKAATTSSSALGNSTTNAAPAPGDERTSSLPAHPLDQLARDVEAEPGAARRARQLGARAVELLEDPALLGEAGCRGRSRATTTRTTPFAGSTRTCTGASPPYLTALSSEVHEHLLDPVARAASPHRPRGATSTSTSAVGGSCARIVFDGLARELAEVDGLRSRRRACRGRAASRAARPR